MKSLINHSVVIHIGTPKTGTTSLQKFLHKNSSDLLEREGICYPRYGRYGPNHHAHHDIALSLRGDSRSLESDTDKLLADVHAEIEGIRQCVLSTEFFFNHLSQNAIDRLIESFDGASIAVVAYLRRQDDKIRSQYNQDLRSKKRMFDSFSAFIERRLGADHENYHARLDLWRRAVGKENIFPRVYHGKFDTTADFCSLLGVDADAYKKTKMADNVSISGGPLELLRACNEVRDPSFDQDDLIKALKWCSEILGEPPGPIITLEQRQRIMGHYAESNRKVAAMYLNQEELFPSVETAESTVNGGGDFEQVAEFIIQLHKSMLEK